MQPLWRTCSKNDAIQTSTVVETSKNIFHKQLGLIERLYLEARTVMFS
jgi:hypothetical protein